MLLEFILLPGVQSSGLGLKPFIDLFLGAEILVDVPCLVDQVKHNTVFHRFVEFVGVDVAAEDLQGSLLVLLQERRACEADENRVRHHCLHCLIQLSALSAVALVYKDEDLAHGMARLGLQIPDEGLEIVHILPAELVHQRAEQAGLGLAQLSYQVTAAAGAIDGLTGIIEDSFYLLVQLVPIGDDGHAGARIVL